MKPVLVGLVAGGLLFCPSAPATNTAQLKADAEAKVQTFAKTLKGELLTAINQGGLVNAIDVCNLKAPAIAAQLSTDGWSVKRTALRVRNPANAPDDWERNVLDYFSATMAKQPAPPFIQATSVGAAPFRYMQTIKTGQLCLACHGSNLSTDVQAALTKRYPQDQATGFKLGDLRGAFSLQYEGPR